MQQRAITVVRALYDRLQTAAIALAEPVGGEMAVRLRMSPDRPGVLQEPLNRFLSHYTNASGLVYLAFCTPEERAAVERRYPFAEYGAVQWQTPGALDAFLERVRRLDRPPVDRIRRAHRTPPVIWGR
ncbi:MAG: hypothetical protein A3K19_06795 [Lentisphaerae bacterium RIFOXYB12_FULL_65_16]|nr:MAG: hypothetical protein A3K18_21975 [Lentisphaerae bacterium RIFOXYA12_64_32]OGV93157.1 MAG: hypothetical protein A3K19_06795 [Lentisphaerae bacterium RIFOXYB12_FULL_65_16]